MKEIQNVIKKCKELENNKSIINFLEDRIIQIRKDAGQFYIYVIKGGVVAEHREGVQAEELQEALMEVWA